jgi:hypothetical protein
METKTIQKFLQENLAEQSMAKQNLEKIARDFINSNESSDSKSIQFKYLLPLFSPKKILAIRRGIAKRSEYEFILASVRQRNKKSHLFDKKDKYEGSTWNEEFISSAFISWFTQTSSPVIKINVNSLNSDNVLTVWDGESKFQIMWYFINQGATDMFRVLKEDGTFMDEVQNFMQHSIRFKTQLNESVIDELLEMFITVKEQSQSYINVEWLYTNGFNNLILYLLNLKATCVFQNLPEEVEGEAYHREGKVGAKQTDVQLINSRIKEVWFEKTRFDASVRPKFRFQTALKNSVFASDKSVFFRDIYKDIFEGENYQGYDEYIWDFFLSLLFEIDTRGKVKYGMPEIYPPNFLSGIARPYDKGTLLVSEKMIQYKEYLANPTISNSQKESFDKKLIEIFRMMEQIFGYAGPTNSDKYPSGIGLLDERILDISRQTSKSEKKKNIKSIKDKQIDELRELLSNYNIVRERGLGFIEKFVFSNHLLVFSILKTISYVIENTDVKDNQLTTILYEILNIVKREWIDYAFNYDIISEPKIFDYNRDDTNNVVAATGDLSVPKLFGLYYSVNGGNLEKVAYVFQNFLNKVVEPKLDNIYLNATSTTKEMRKFKIWLKNTKGKQPEQFYIFDTENDTPLELDRFDIGHPEAESFGNILFHREFLLEERVHNRHKFQTDSKDVKSYYRCLMANHNDILKLIQNSELSWSDKVAKWTEANGALENLKLLLEYIEQPYDVEASYLNDTVKKEEYIK